MKRKQRNVIFALEEVSSPWMLTLKISIKVVSPAKAFPCPSGKFAPFERTPESRSRVILPRVLLSAMTMEILLVSKPFGVTRWMVAFGRSCMLLDMTTVNVSQCVPQQSAVDNRFRTARCSIRRVRRMTRCMSMIPRAQVGESTSLSGRRTNMCDPDLRMQIDIQTNTALDQ